MHRIKRKTCCLIIVAIVMLAGCGKEEPAGELLGEADTYEKTSLESDETEEEPEGTICVYVCGQVAKPGVYELPGTSRIYEAVEAAGGLLDTAAGESLNQAEKMSDGQKIYVPSKEEAEAFTDQDGRQNVHGSVTDGKVNLNTASMEELMTLPGIGEAKAAAILRYREEHGAFGSAEEIMQVEGIKTGVYEKIKDQIKI